MSMMSAKSCTNFMPFLTIANPKTIQTTIEEMIKLLVMWLVKVKNPGIKPNKLPNNMNKNILDTNGMSFS
jgi:hypothetical protein